MLCSLFFATFAMACADEEAAGVFELKPAFEIEQIVYTVDDCDDVIGADQIENARPLDSARRPALLEIATIRGQSEESVMAVSATICAERSNDEVWVKANRTN